jgi:hypothetical protein
MSSINGSEGEAASSVQPPRSIIIVIIGYYQILPTHEDALISSPTAAQPDAVNTSPPSPAYDNTAPISDAMQQ